MGACDQVNLTWKTAASHLPPATHGEAARGFRSVRDTGPNLAAAFYEPCRFRCSEVTPESESPRSSATNKSSSNSIKTKPIGLVVEKSCHAWCTQLEVIGMMQRYYFHFLWADDAVRDKEGVALQGFDAAYSYACRLVHRVRSHFPAAEEDWWIEVDDGSNPIVVLPAMVPSGRGREASADNVLMITRR